LYSWIFKDHSLIFKYLMKASWQNHLKLDYLEKNGLSFSCRGMVPHNKTQANSNFLLKKQLAFDIAFQ